MAADRAFLGISALLFGVSVALTILWCASMSEMPGMPMPGGWTMSMAWMRMPGQTWLGTATSFVGMWAVMVVAMMANWMAILFVVGVMDLRAMAVITAAITVERLAPRIARPAELVS